MTKLTDHTLTDVIILRNLDESEKKIFNNFFILSINNYTC